MQIKFAHLREPSTNGGWIDFAVFEARSNTGGDPDNSRALQELTVKAKMAGHKVDQSALAFTEHGRLKFFGSKPLVEHLSRSWRGGWTHTMDV